MFSLLAQVVGGYSLFQLAIFIVVVAGLVAVVVIILKQLGVTVPQWLQAILWVILVVIVGIFAIKVIASML